MLADSAAGLRAQLAALAATGNSAVLPDNSPFITELETSPEARAISWRATPDWRSERHLGGILVEGDPGRIAAVCRAVAEFAGPIVNVQSADSGGHYDQAMLMREVSISINTTAAGGNANLMALHDTESGP